MILSLQYSIYFTVGFSGSLHFLISSWAVFSLLCPSGGFLVQLVQLRWHFSEFLNPAWVRYPSLRLLIFFVCVLPVCGTCFCVPCRGQVRASGALFDHPQPYCLETGFLSKLEVCYFG